MRLARPVGLAFALALLVTQPAAADIITPNTLTDEYNANAGTCSLREAVQASNTDMPFNGCPTGNGADEIQLGNGTYQLSRGEASNTNADGELDVTAGDTLTISHAGAERTAIDGGDLDRVLYNSGTLTISGLALQNGSATGSGGGIFTDGTLTMTNAAVLNNDINGFAGGINVFNGSTTTLTNTTVSGNRVVGGVAGSGGGVSVGIGATLNVNNATITNNNAHATTGEGGGVHMNGATMNMKNTVIAGNTAAALPDCRPVNGSTVNSLGYNLIGNTSGCGYTLGTGDQIDVPAGLNALADNGGPTSTHALVVGSNAVDQIPPASCGGLTADQRGYPRPSGTNCDVGAYEQFLCNGTPLNSPGAFPGMCPPAPPTLTGTSPPSPANDNNPEVFGTAEAGSTVSLYDNATCTGVAAFTGPESLFASPGFTVTVLDNSTTTFSATATNGVGTSPCSTVNVSYTEVTPAPPPVANTPPGNPTSPINPAGNVRKRKCKKKGAGAAKKKCKRKKK